MRTRLYFVYILTNKNNQVLYTGVTNNLEWRVSEHKQKLVEGFTKKYNVDKLVWYAVANDVRVAITEEKRIKGWLRKKKLALIEKTNPEWNDLNDGWNI